MKQLLLLLFLPISLLAQQEMSLFSGKIPLKKYGFNITNVIDKTEQPIIGYFFNNAEITFKTSVKGEFQAIIENNKKSSENYTLSVDYVDINEKKEGEVYMANVSVGFSLHKKNNNALVEICNYKNSIYHALDSKSERNRTNTYKRIIKYFVELAFEDFSNDLQKKDNLEHEPFTKNHNEGVYYSYDDYLKGEADTQFTPDIKKVKENDNKPDYLKVFFLDEGNVLKLYKAWGMVIDGDLYANVNDIFYLININDPNNIYTHCRPHFYIRSSGKAASYGQLVGGAVGAMVAIALTKDKIIDDREARLYPFEKLKFNKKTGALILNEIAHKKIEGGFYLSLSPDAKIDSIELTINGDKVFFQKSKVIKIDASKDAAIEICHPLIYKKEKCISTSLNKKRLTKVYQITTGKKGGIQLLHLYNDWEALKVIKKYYLQD